VQQGRRLPHGQEPGLPGGGGFGWDHNCTVDALEKRSNTFLNRLFPRLQNVWPRRLLEQENGTHTVQREAFLLLPSRCWGQPKFASNETEIGGLTRDQEPFE
jgi:hypothetical protein